MNQLDHIVIAADTLQQGIDYLQAKLDVDIPKGGIHQTMGTHNHVMQLANEAGYEVIEKRITRDEVYIADEAFFTGTAAEVTPIREIDGRSIGSGTRGPVTEQLQSKYFDVVHGRSPEHMHWLTIVK